MCSNVTLRGTNFQFGQQLGELAIEAVGGIACNKKRIA